MTKYIFLLATAILWSGCQLNPFGKSDKQEHIEQALNQSADANQKATKQVDWQGSADDPEQMFSEFRQKVAAKELTVDDVGNALLSLPPETLTLFEAEIEKSENAEILGKYKELLQQKLEAYWRSVRIKPKTPETRPTKSDQGEATDKNMGSANVVLRDTTQGYKAINGDLPLKQVALTFDDGPHITNTDVILKALKNEGIRATFFEMGSNVRKFPFVTSRVAANGHSIGSHSQSHACLGNKRICMNSNGGRVLSFAGAINEIRAGHQAIYDVLGWVDPFFRFPYGESDSKLQNFLRQNSIGEFYWNIDSEDWRARLRNGDINTPERLVQNVMTQVRQQGRGIILLHDIQKRTTLALPEIIRQLKVEGFQLVVFQSTDSEARFNSRIVSPRNPVN